MDESRVRRLTNWVPELLLVLIVWMSFFAALGEMDVWGRREQRLAAEVVDTLNGNWIVAYLKGQPRLEKPPLCRWLGALSMLLTGRRDEFALRLPFALGGAITVLVLYLWGTQAHGRIAGLGAAVVFCTFSQVVAELRQGSADALLVPLTTASLWFWWQSEANRSERVVRRYRLLSGLCAGLGVLAKGPVAIMIILIAIGVYAAVARVNVRPRLLDGRWWLAASLTALPWPVLVAVHMPRAILVWGYEMGLKLGAVPEPEVHRSLPLLLRFPELIVPWIPLAIAGALLPVVHRSTAGAFKTDRRWWLVWGWAIGNLVVFSFWKIAKPSYYLPCLPAIGLLCGLAWATIVRAATDGLLHWRQKLVLITQWGLFALAGPGLLGAAYVVEQRYLWVAGIVFAAGLAAWNLATVRWSKPDGLAWLGLCHAVLAVAIFNVVLPSMDRHHSHRNLARSAEELRSKLGVPLLAMPNTEESVWFYMDRPPRPVRNARQVARIASRNGTALVIGDVRDIRRLQGLTEIEVEPLIDQSGREGRKGLIVASVRPTTRETARHNGFGNSTR